MKNSIESILSQSEACPRILELFSSANGKLIIEETDEYRWIRDNNNAYYSILDKSLPARLVLPYLQTMMASLLFIPEPESTLLLGAGGGAILRFLNEYYPDNDVYAIDYDDRVIDITMKYFLKDLTIKKSIKSMNAIDYISTTSHSNFDLMFVDLFSHGSIPDFFNEISFYENCKQTCGNGVVVFNLVIENESSFNLIMSLLLFVFNNRCLCLAVTDYKNIIVLAFTENFEIERDVTILRNKCENIRYSFNLDFDVLLDDIISTNKCTNGVLQF